MRLQTFDKTNVRSPHPSYHLLTTRPAFNKIEYIFWRLKVFWNAGQQSIERWIAWILCEFNDLILVKSEAFSDLVGNSESF
ncbi:MAG: hypothetical protein GPJ14_11190 [Microcystis aeruginosa G11-01]|nr:hypothetical protein [Microcystis aeruginosa G11-01]